MAQTTTRAYDPFGNLLTETLPSPSAAVRTTTMTHDLMDRVVTSTAPLGVVTRRVFDLGGRVTSLTEAFGNALARTTTFTYDANDRVRVTTYPDSATNSYTSFRQTVTDPGGFTTTTYPKPAAWASGVTRTVSPAGRVTESVTDSAGQTVLTRIAPGTADATTTSHTYDLLGRRITTTVDPGGLNLTTTVDPGGLNLTTTVAYDAIGRMVSSTDPLNRSTQTTYQMAVAGDPVSPGTRQRVIRTLPDNRQQTTRLDALGRTLSETDPKNQTIRHSYWYETAQKLTLTDARNFTTT